ncbi:MAG: hypothetical protein ACXVYM_06035 [Gaiellaceae bacterium]
MGFLKDLRNLQKMGKEMVPPEQRGVAGGFRAIRDSVAQQSQMMSDLAEQQQQAQALMTSGLVGQAMITALADTGVTVNENPQVRLSLTVTIPGREPYEATLTQIVSRLAIASFQPGSVVPVRVSPDDPQLLMIA